MEFIPLTYYTLSGLLNFITSLALLIFVFSKNPKSYITQTFSLFAFTVAGWGLSYVLWLTAKNQYLAEFYLRTLMIFVIFIPSTFAHFILTFVKVNFNKKLVLVNYLISLSLGLMVYTPLFAKDISPYLVFPYWLRPSIFFHFHTIHFFVNVIYSHLLMLRAIKRNSGIFKNQIRYVFIGTALGYIGGGLNYLTWYRLLSVPPFLNPLVSIYVASVSYAIIKYRLMDIRIVVTRIGIFVVVYSLLLGIPFGVGVKIFGLGLWMIPTGICAVLATVCPFIFLYIQHRTEERLLQEEIKLEKFLKDLSNGMNDIKDLSRLLNLIVDLLVKGIKITNSAIYLLEIHDEHHQYVLKSSNPKEGTLALVEAESPLISALEKREPLVYEELKLDSDGGNSPQSNLEGVLLQIETLHASVIVPIIMGDTMLGFLVLGGRRDKKIYSQRVLTSLSNLANQAASVIENCKYWAEKMKQMEEEGLLARISSLDNMANSMAHVIGNPVHIISMALGNAKLCLKRDLRISMPEEIKTDILESLERSEQAAERIGGIIDAILDYSRMGTGKMEPINVNDVMKGFLFLIEPLITHVKVKFIHDIEPSLPIIIGNKIHLEEIIMYFVTNSLHAVKKKEEGRITLKIFRKDNDTMRIECIDNGYGISPKKIKDIFLAYETSKGADGVKKNEGFGLGLFRARKIVDLYKGHIWAESQGEGKGAAFIVELPVYQEDNKHH